MRNEQTAKIVSIIDAFLNSCNLSDIRKLSASHENSWKEFLNGNKNSQLEAQEKSTKVVSDIIEALPESGIEYLIRLIEK